MISNGKKSDTGRRYVDMQGGNIMGTLSEAAKEARRAYKRKWRQGNKEKCEEYQERFWNNLAMKMCQDYPNTPTEATPIGNEHEN